MQSKVTFTDDVIQSMFGHEAAEDEEPDRLKNYYFKTSAYEKVHSQLDLRILVGHKGEPTTFFLSRLGVSQSRELPKSMNV